MAAGKRQKLNWNKMDLNFSFTSIIGVLLFISLFLNPCFSFKQSNVNIRKYFSVFPTAIKDDIAEVSATADILTKNMEEFVRLRGTAELVDLLENLVSKHPGIELDLNLYRALYPFPLDDFQVRGIQSLMEGNNVLVTTPTGSGKTVVGELAIYFALMMGLKIAYTTPLKALSNQKFADFKARYGGDRVGLLTGDIAINRGAPITIMTTEVFRNMIYDQDSENQLSNLFTVIFDEFHYMNDYERGTVWEESVISCPAHIRILALSATMGNVGDIKGWISSIHGPTELIFSDHRPVPLRYLFAMKQGLMPLFRDPNAGPGALSGVQRIEDGKLNPGSMMNPSILKLEEQARKAAQAKALQKGKPLKTAKISENNLVPKYSDIAVDLHNAKLLPAIIFIFSRVGCEQNAKLVMQQSVKLLNETEVTYVTKQINLFIRRNPEIPVSRQMVQMIRAGVAVHHAGLIPVWKGFVEDLFNANKIKVLFATETLAAGVNMPARTTVIASVTKRVNSEVIKLKTSQLLQMAGRAGRRGKDVEGTVVIMRSRFEDVKLGHKILTSAVDGIKSHFKTSYGLTVKLLETRSLGECKTLIERGFGAYLLQQRQFDKKIKEEVVNEEDVHRAILQKYGLKTAREFLKIARRLEKERNNLEFLKGKLKDSDNDLIQAIADYMPAGIGIYLINGQTGYFVGDIGWGDSSSTSSGRNRGFGIITQDGRILLAQKEHIQSFSDVDGAIPRKYVESLLNIFDEIELWEEIEIPNCKKDLLEGFITKTRKIDQEKLTRLNEAKEYLSTISPLPSKETPGSIIRQEMVVDGFIQELAASPITIAGDGTLILKALKYISTLRDPIAFVNALPKESSNGPVEIYAWRMFQNVLELLRQFGALEGTKSTELGQMVGSLTSDNELWLALVLQQKSVLSLEPSELAAVLSGIVVDGYKASNAFIRYSPSEKVMDVFRELQVVSSKLTQAQEEVHIDFPVHLSVESAGLVESWVKGVTWRELCGDTSLDQGDLCRLLRRTVEVLAQIPQAYGVPPLIAQRAYEASKLMDRFPVADEITTVDREQLPGGTSGVGFGGTGDAFKESDFDNIDIELSELKESEEYKNGMDVLDLLFGEGSYNNDNNLEESIPIKKKKSDSSNGNGLDLSEIDFEDFNDEEEPVVADNEDALLRALNEIKNTIKLKEEKKKRKRNSTNLDNFELEDLSTSEVQLEVDDVQIDVKTDDIVNESEDDLDDLDLAFDWK